MPRRTLHSGWLWASLLLVVTLVMAACSAPAPAGTDTQAPAAEAPATGAEEAEEADEAGETEAAATPEAEEEAADEGTQIVQQSEAAQSQVVGGVEVVSDEEVTSQRDRRGGEYRSTTTSDIVNFHPYLTTDTASSTAQANLYDGSLLRYDENTLDLIPNMAESYTISEDGLTYTYVLREGIEWSDGTPVTAHDFEWTFNQAIKPENEYPYLSNYADITSYKALDDRTIEIKVKEVYCPALTLTGDAVTPLPKHIWETLDWKDPEKNPEILKPTVTNGPYKLEEWVRDAYSVFEANENYWYHGAPNITRLVDEIVPDPDISYQKMKSGETDTGTILPENLEEARQLDNITVYEWWPARASWSYIGLNMRREGAPTQDVNVRHGIAYAIDKDIITEEIMEGQAKRQCSAFPDTSWAYNPDVPCYDYDPDQAIASFEAAGYTFDGTTMLTPEGEPLTLRLIYGPNTNKVRELIALQVQNDLAQIGVEVEIQAMEWASYLEATQDPEIWDMFILGWSSTVEPQFMYQIWAEENIPSLNRPGYINPEVEALFDEAGRNCAVEDRKAAFGEIQRILAEDMPYVFLYYQKSWSGQNNRIGGIDPKPVGLGWNSLDWYITEE